VNDHVVACALSIIIDYSKFGDDHTYEQVTGMYSFSTHDDEGEYYMVSMYLCIPSTGGCASAEGCMMLGRNYASS
jgi:hypothetical protein